PAVARFGQRDLRRALHRQLLAVDAHARSALGLAQYEMRDVAGRDVVLRAVVAAPGIHIGAVVVFAETIDRDPMGLVVPRGVSDEADAVRRPAAARDILAMKCVEPLAEFRRRAMRRLFRYQKLNVRRLHAAVPGIERALEVNP